MEERFVINDLMDNAYSVTWPGYEMVVCDNERKATNLLKILFDEVDVEDATLAVKVAEYSDKDYIISIPWYTYHQNPDGAGRFLVGNHAVVGCKFPNREQAEKFKTIMDKRLAWRRLSGRGWA
jgi:hypothetical protein